MKAAGITFAPYQALTARCRDRAGGDADLAATCGHIAQTMFDHSDTLMAHTIGGAVHKLLTGDASWLDRAHQDTRLAGQRVAASAPVDATPCGDSRRFLDHFVQLDALGEVPVAWEARPSASAP